MTTRLEGNGAPAGIPVPIGYFPKRRTHEPGDYHVLRVWRERRPA